MTLFLLNKYSKQINFTLTSTLAILLITLIPVSLRTAKNVASVSQRDGYIGDGPPTDNTPTYAPITDAQECPVVSKPDARAVIGKIGGAPGQKVWVKRSDKLCTIWQVNPSGSRLVPVARSYEGHDWESYSSEFGLVDIKCVPSACSITLPEFVDEGNYFEMAAFDHSLPWRDEVARFLEQTTFGPTRESINSFPETFAQWVKEQQDENLTPLSSHRQFFRERLTYRSNSIGGIGVITHPCKAGTQYRKHAFTEQDGSGSGGVRLQTIGGRRVFSKSAQRITVVDAELTFQRGGSMVTLADGNYNLCSIQAPSLSTNIQLTTPAGCSRIFANGNLWTIPEIFFDDEIQPTNPVISLDGHVKEIGQEFFDGQVKELYIESDLDDKNCDLVPEIRRDTDYLVVGKYKGEYWLHDPRYIIFENTPENPLMDGGASVVESTRLNEEEVAAGASPSTQVQCMTAPIHMLNFEYCRLSTDPNACSSLDPSPVSVDLSTETLARIYDATGQGDEGTRYLYVVDGLRQDENTPYAPPCAPGAMSRWVQANNCRQSATGSTIEIFAQLLLQSNDKNPFVRDIAFPITGINCHPSDANRYGFDIIVGNVCWRNVHQSHYSIFDFTDWVNLHPGGPEAIKSFAMQSVANPHILQFPDSHEMKRFYDTKDKYLVEVGRLGDTSLFSEFPQVLLTNEIAEEFDALDLLKSLGPTVVCGSPYETKNNPTNFGNFLTQGAFDSKSNLRARDLDLRAQRRIIWYMIALMGKDSLRQRVAWTLSQILCISPGGVGLGRDTETWVYYYDIFVRHAFGNYRDVLKEVAYSPMMAMMLSFGDNASTDFLFRSRGQLEYPDENFAREIMQLFSIGLFKLNNDGSPRRDVDGIPLLTYTNDEIVEYARVWTGFRSVLDRGNIEIGNRLDPMNVRTRMRDMFPKLGLDGKYIGDGLPLCSDLPDKHFLKRGATYILLGSLPIPRFHYESQDWVRDSKVRRLSLTKRSSLYKTLCNPGTTGECQYNTKVVIGQDLPCTDDECDIEAPRVIQVGDGIFYEYLRLPCAFEAFYDKPQSLHGKRGYSCGDPGIEAGGVGCCKADDNKWFYEEFGSFDGERMSFYGTQKRCSEQGLGICFQPRYGCTEACDLDIEYWGSSPCLLKVKVGLDGTVALVHAATPEFDKTQRGETKIIQWVAEDTKSFFRVVWDQDITQNLLDYSEMCASLGCPRDRFDNLCLCTVSVENSIAFNSPPTREEVLDDLAYGAFSPYTFWEDREVVDLGNGVKLHARNGNYQMESVFEVTDENGITRFRKNKRSTVFIGSEKNGLRLSFRNPTHMMAINDLEERDAHYETDATLDHYFYHANTAPFLAKRFAQRFGISNPSPRYIDSIATSFRKGQYVDIDSGLVFGSGSYGDLAAAIAAVILDREARSVILEADPTYGSLLEPLLRYLRLMKSLEFKPSKSSPMVRLEGMLKKIGQDAHDLPGVFSFFLPEYQPPGPVGNAGLVCPECQVMSGPMIVFLLNGAMSLLKYGLDQEYGGFGTRRSFNQRVIGNTATSSGWNTYTPESGLDSAGIIDELATLLTSGRLTKEKRESLVSIYEKNGGGVLGLIRAQEIIATSPEFHANGLARTTEQRRTLPATQQQTAKPYKAIVEIFLGGGYDSYNVLVPEICDGKNAAGQTVDAQYRNVRGQLALSRNEIQHQIVASNQPCSRFAIHPSAPIIRELYDEGSLAWLANVGVVNTAEMNNKNYEAVTVSTLFGHNTMSFETHVVDPYRKQRGSGIFGRLSEVLTTKGFKTSGISIDFPSPATAVSGNAPRPETVSRSGLVQFYPRPVSEKEFDFLDHASAMNAVTEKYSNMFGESFSSEFLLGVHRGKKLDELLERTELGPQWSNEENIFEQLATVARLMQTRKQRGVDRDMFMTSFGGWDHHGELKLNLSIQMDILNRAIRMFVDELKALDLWNNVAIVVTSEFGRTLSMNGKEGTDHAWAGHYMLMGGDVKGKQVLGEYPNDLTTEGPWSIGRGRMMPSTSWDAVWNGIGEWMGVESEEEMLRVLPNLPRTHGGSFTPPLKATDLFRS